MPDHHIKEMFHIQLHEFLRTIKILCNATKIQNILFDSDLLLPSPFGTKKCSSFVPDLESKPLACWMTRAGQNHIAALPWHFLRQNASRKQLIYIQCYSTDTIGDPTMWEKTLLCCNNKNHCHIPWSAKPSLHKRILNSWENGQGTLMTFLHCLYQEHKNVSIKWTHHPNWKYLMWQRKSNGTHVLITWKIRLLCMDQPSRKTSFNMPIRRGESGEQTARGHEQPQIANSVMRMWC